MLLSPLVACSFLLSWGMVSGEAHVARDASEAAVAVPEPVDCGGCAVPGPHARAQYQLTPADGHNDTGGIAVNVMAKPFRRSNAKHPGMFDIDLYVDSAVSGDVTTLNEDAVDALHNRGAYVTCYVSAGSWESWRADADDFPVSVKGDSNGWPGERWLDVRDTDTLLPLMEARLEKCVAAGFDAVEWDNVDGYTNDTGFPLTAHDQLVYNVALANMTHEHGLAVGLKNDLSQIKTLVDYFDFAVNEQCAQYNECRLLNPFLAAGKLVVEIEYNKKLAGFCPAANRAGRSAMLKALKLGAKPWTPCD